jgi:hypothetical protein
MLVTNVAHGPPTTGGPKGFPGGASKPRPPDVADGDGQERSPCG